MERNIVFGNHKFFYQDHLGPRDIVFLTVLVFFYAFLVSVFFATV